MIAGHWRVRAAAALLTGWSGEREALAQAADELWVACFHSDSWPAEIKAWSDKLKPQLSTQGTARQTIFSLSQEEARDFADELLRFCEAALSPSA